MENLIGEEGEGFRIAMKALDGGRVSIASCSVGGAQACLDMARDHMLVRKQFGKTLSEFQHLQFKLADMAINLTASRQMVRTAAQKMDEEVCLGMRQGETRKGAKIVEVELVDKLAK